MSLCLPISLPLQNLFSVDCEWSSWGDYSTCSVTCGTGTQIRERTKLVVEDNGGQPCSGSIGYHQDQQCHTAPCPGTTHKCFFTVVCISVGTMHFLRPILMSLKTKLKKYLFFHNHSQAFYKNSIITNDRMIHNSSIFITTSIDFLKQIIHLKLSDFFLGILTGCLVEEILTIQQIWIFFSVTYGTSKLPKF